ncbi:MAG: HD domain-containing protein, partial [Candidatus Firestonebacteria bacterium]|nr:HD domain-containing protein [Candidatus Firestonebacteria bacterium]
TDEIIALKKINKKNDDIYQKQKEMESIEEEFLSIINKVIKHEKDEMQEKQISVYNNLNDFKNKNIAVSLFVVFLAIVLGFLYSKKISIPITELKDAANGVGSGKFNIRVNIKSNDEISFLAESFNKMVNDLDISYRKINMQNQELMVLNNKNDEINKALVLTVKELEAASEKLQKEKEFKEIITDNIDEGIMLLSKDLKILWANKKIKDLCDFSKNKIEDYYCYKITHNSNTPCAPPDDICPVTEILNTGKAVTVEHIHYGKDNKKIYVEVNAYPVKETSGEITQFVHLTRDITERKLAEEKIRKSLEKEKRILNETVNSLSQAAEKRDSYTAGHQKRVADLACAIAREMNFLEYQIEGIRIAGILHDIGKIYVPDEILNDPKRLSEMHFNIVKNHSKFSYEILMNIEFPWPVAQIVLQHHERLNGSGYPNGLSGDEILIEAKIIGVADVVEAMANKRPYRPALGIEKALEEIINNKGILYQSEIVNACLKLFQEKYYKFSES